VRIARRIVLSILAVGLALYLLILIWFWANQDSLVFFPERGKIPAPPAYLGGEARAARFTGQSGSLVAWVIPPPAAADSARWVLILHGNAGNLATPGRPEHDRQLHDLGLGVLAPDYRGYGESEGKPSEAGLYADARSAYDFLRDSLRIPPNRIVIYGHSLGSAVATQLATSVDAAGLILEGSFTSVADLGQEIYPWLPVRWLSRNRFDSKGRIGNLRMPLLMIHGRNDMTVPLAQGRRLFAAAPEPKTFLEVPGGHDDAFETGAEAYEAGIRRFLGTLRGP
jgi:fermentation-respiration switch protein FrsA (DUF1100 family)